MARLTGVERFGLSFAAMLLAAALPSTATAQPAGAMDLSARGMLGFIPFPFGSDGCGGGQVAAGGQVLVTRGITSALGVQIAAAVAQELDAIACAEALGPRPPGVYEDRLYEQQRFRDPLLMTDVRLAAQTGGRRVRASLAGGLGLALPPHSSPYAIVAAGLRFGRDARVDIGVEYRAFRIPHELVRTTISEFGPATQVHVGSGHDWGGSGFLAIGINIPL